MSQYFKRYLIIIILFFFVGCNSTNYDAEGIPNSIQGLWKSEVFEGVSNEDVILLLDLKQDGPNITGTITIDKVNKNDNGQVKITDGQYYPPDLLVSSPDFSISCVVQDKNTMICDTDSGGVALTRQQTIFATGQNICASK